MENQEINLLKRFFMKTIKITFILLLFSFKFFALTYTSVGCPANWSGFNSSCPFFNGGTRLDFQPTPGDILTIPSGCTVTVIGVITVNNDITLIMNGQLKFSGLNDQLHLSSGTTIIVNSGGSISGVDNSNKIKIGTGSAEWSGPGTNFGPFTLVNETFLPIELVYFTGKLTPDNRVNIAWQTATESNNNYFEIERSENGIDFITISEIKSKSENGNSLKTLNYQMIDINTLPGISYYRLKQVDFDGYFTYSNVESIEWHAKGEIKIVPNPIDQLCTIKFEEGNSIKQLEIFNSIGEIVKTISLMDLTQKTIQLDFFNMATGIYYLKADGSILKQKLVKL